MANPLEKTDTRPVTFETTKRNFEAIKKKFDARRPQLDEFSVEKGGPYSAAEVKRDNAWLTAKKKQIFVDSVRGANPEMEEKRLYAEYVFMEMVDSGELFDNDVVAVMPGSEFDDLANGADAIVTFCEDKGGIDFAFSVDIKASLTDQSENVEKAEQQVQEKAYSGRGSWVKYFIHGNAEDDTLKRATIELPNLVLWFEPENIQTLMVALSKKEKEKTSADKKIIASAKSQLYQRMAAYCQKIFKTLDRSSEQAAPDVRQKVEKIRRQYKRLADKVNEYENE